MTSGAMPDSSISILLCSYESSMQILLLLEFLLNREDTTGRTLPASDSSMASILQAEDLFQLAVDSRWAINVSQHSPHVPVIGLVNGLRAR